MAVILGKTCQFLKEIQTILARLKLVRKSKDAASIELIGEFEATISKFKEYLTSLSLSVEDQCDGISFNNPPISLLLKNKTANINESATQPTSNDNWTDASIADQVSDVNFSPLEDLAPSRNSFSSGHNEDWAAAVLTSAVGEAGTCPNPIMLVTNEASVEDDRVVLQGDHEGHDQVVLQGNPDGDDQAMLQWGCEGHDQLLLQEYLPTESGLQVAFATDDEDDLSSKRESESVYPDQRVVIERDRDRIELKTRCSICLKGFDRDCRLRQHMYIKHEGGVLDKQVCPFCGKNFESKYLKSHISATHEGKEMICNVCAKTFATISALNAHRKNVHGGRRFACHNCNKSFASKWGLEVHFGKEHEIRRFPCELCESGFKSSNLLRRHMQGVHERIRHSCPNCSASFTQKSQLTYHVKLKHRLGREDGRLVCEKCKKVFVVPFKMREHRKKCMAVLESNAGYAHIAASLAERNELPEKT